MSTNNNKGNNGAPGQDDIKKPPSKRQKVNAENNSDDGFYGPPDFQVMTNENINAIDYNWEVDFILKNA